MRFPKIKLAVWQPWFKGLSGGKKIFIAGGILALIAAVYLTVAIFSISPAELKLAELRNSWQWEKICHEECAKVRASQEKLIISDLKNQPESRAARQLEKYFLAEEENVSFRIELISLASRAWGKEARPEYFKEYLANLSGRPDIQAEIINSYGASEPLSYYFDILAGPRDWRLKQAAVGVLSNYPSKAADFSASQLVLARKIVLNPDTDIRLRRSLVLLLGDYHPLFPKETDEILRAVYQAKFSDDSISRAFAADILNRLSGAKLAVPEVSAAQWDEYYNN